MRQCPNAKPITKKIPKDTMMGMRNLFKLINNIPPAQGDLVADKRPLFDPNTLCTFYTDIESVFVFRC